jgi:YesN/AraC family two-component response regulator
MKFPEKTFSKIKAILDEYYREYGERIPNGLLVEGLVSYILGLAEAEHGRVEKREKPGELMIEVLEYIKKNADSDLTIANLAAKFGYTPNYFSSLFNKFVQMSFNDYLNYVRYTRAAEIIQLQGCTATNIAMKCGFGSMNTFYRAKNKFDKKS